MAWCEVWSGVLRTILGTHCADCEVAKLSLRVTHHAESRVRERMGIRKRTVGNVAQKALELGIRHSETKGSLKRYLDGLYLAEKTANNMRIYSGKVFLFHGQVLITVINLPARYHDTIRKMASKRANS